MTLRKNSGQAPTSGIIIEDGLMCQNPSWRDLATKMPLDCEKGSLTICDEGSPTANRRAMVTQLSLRLEVPEKRVGLIETYLGSGVRKKPVNPAKHPSIPNLREAVEIIGIDPRVAERNSLWTKYSWKLSLSNLTDERLFLDCVIQFPDVNGFELESARKDGLPIEARESQSYAGVALVNASIAD